MKQKFEIKKKASIGPTLVWIPATIIILFLVVLFLVFVTGSKLSDGVFKGSIDSTNYLNFDRLTQNQKRVYFQLELVNLLNTKILENNEKFKDVIKDWGIEKNKKEDFIRKFLTDYFSKKDYRYNNYFSIDLISLNGGEKNVNKVFIGDDNIYSDHFGEFGKIVLLVKNMKMEVFFYGEKG